MNIKNGMTVERRYKKKGKNNRIVAEMTNYCKKVKFKRMHGERLHVINHHIK